MSERERKMKKDVWSSLYWPFRVFCCCICQQTISKSPHTIFFSFLAWYIDISVVRWLGKCSRNKVEVSSIYFFFLVRRLKKGSYIRCPRIFLPHNVVNDESGEIGCGWRKGQSYINNFHIFLASFSFIYIFFFQFIFQYIFFFTNRGAKRDCELYLRRNTIIMVKKIFLTCRRNISSNIWRNSFIHSFKYFLHIFQLTL